MAKTKKAKESLCNNCINISKLESKPKKETKKTDPTHVCSKKVFTAKMVRGKLTPEIINCEFYSKNG